MQPDLDLLKQAVRGVYEFANTQWNEQLRAYEVRSDLVMRGNTLDSGILLGSDRDVTAAWVSAAKKLIACGQMDPAWADHLFLKEVAGVSHV